MAMQTLHSYLQIDQKKATQGQNFDLQFCKECEIIHAIGIVCLFTVEYNSVLQELLITSSYTC